MSCIVDEKECLFCRIVKGEIPAKKVYEDSDTFAFLDINPRNPGHTLVIPKKHYENLLEMPDKDAASLIQSVKKIAAMAMNGMKAQGVSISISNGQAAGQIVAHAHFHVIPRFLNEGPVGLESILPTKKMTEEMMDQVVEAISGAKEEAPKEAKSSEKTVSKSESKEPGKPAKKPANSALEEDDEFEDLDDLDF